MNLLDLVVLLLAVGGAVAGFRMGFLARAASWAGFWLGFALGAALLPSLLERMQEASDPTKLMVAVATVFGCAMVGQGIGLTLGGKLHVAVPDGTARQVDRSAGAALGVLGVIVILWLLLPTLGSAPGWAAEQARGSRIAREVGTLLPDPPNAIENLRSLMGDTGFPEVFDALTPAPDTGPPPASAGLTGQQIATLTRSTVKVQGIACDRIQEGSGFVAADDLIVTNAHVVAGEDETQVTFDSGGNPLQAVVVAFDPIRDLAVLRVEGLDEGQHPILPMRDAESGDTGGVFGHPGGNPLDVSPFTVAEEIDADGRDIYDSQPSTRRILVLASQLQPGDSGSALVDRRGNVVGVAFAVAPDDPNVAYALDLSELEPVLAGDLAAARDTGGCLR